MTPSLSLLSIEDSEPDFLLVQRSLKQHGVMAEFRRVDNYSDLREALNSGGWDAVLSDYNIPGLDFRQALDFIRTEAPDLPVILISGSIGEEEAMDLLRRGLSDFVLKDRPTRLAGALRHSLETVRVRKAQRVAEAALLESESRFSTIFRSSPLGIALSRKEDSQFVEVNEAFLEIFGKEREEVIGRTPLELGFFLQAEDRERFIERIRAEHRVSNFQFQFLKGEEVRDLLISGEQVQVGGEDLLLGMVSDITPLKTAERGLRASEFRYRNLFENLVEGFAHCRMIFRDDQPVDFEFLAVNPAFGRLSGLFNVVGRRITDVIPGIERDNPELFQVFGEVAQTGMSTQIETYLPALGIWLWITVYRPDEGEFIAVFDNISDRKLAENALRTSEAKFQAVFNVSPVGILLSRLHTGEIIDANPGFLHLMGYRLDEMLGRTTLDLDFWVRPSDREEVLRQIRRTGHVEARDLELKSRSGEILSVTWWTDRVELGGEYALVNLVQDRTARLREEKERQRLEAEVAHAQKLDSLGALAGGVSHDMNNVLAAIMALGSMLKEKHRDDPVLSKYMDTLLHAAGRGRDLVKGLTDFVRKDIPEPKAMNLNDVVRHEAALLNRTTFQKVAVELVLEEGLPEVMGDSSSISNALMNLSVNALDAMPGGGQLMMTTRRGDLGQVELCVRDTGEGMPPDVVKRAMEPFFTTKPPGKGTGLGLALVYSVMKSHGGRVQILSEPGEGTEIILSFPGLIPGAESSKEFLFHESAVQSSLQILLIDDDDLVRHSVPGMLEALGHRVVALPGGRAALQELDGGLSPDLIILDLSMPGMDGEETLERIRLKLPEVPVLLATGYHDERSERILERFVGVDVVMKPFTLMDIKVKLAQLT
ncbi:PAS domain S-box protein [Geothrix sp. 21YS21S-4]|uniref:hybrid sensor histidine kinase/response regulator n=1 Tax=Geothrix sp. 21YS21S-4 TaxID=3068889 RepID=UPI0027B9BF04|nr:PAS domain S-box protein [Geothrix sp. 21YS21S-4]